MVLLSYNDYLIKFYTSIGSHLLGEVSGWFFKRHFNAESILIDNGVFSLLRRNKQMHYKLVVKYGVQNIKKILNLVRRKDLEIYIVVPDYPYDAKLNYECYRLFKQYYNYLYRNYRTIYVLHGYWESIIDGVDVDLVAIPFNTISDIPYSSLRNEKVWKLHESLIHEIMCKTIEHIKEHGYSKIHVLGATKRTLKKLFKLPQSTLFNSQPINHVKYIESFDTDSWHLAVDDDVREVDYGKGKYMIPCREDEIELKWLFRWLKGLPFKVVKI